MPFRADRQDCRSCSIHTKSLSSKNCWQLVAASSLFLIWFLFTLLKDKSAVELMENQDMLKTLTKVWELGKTVTFLLWQNHFFVLILSSINFLEKFPGSTYTQRWTKRKSRRWLVRWARETARPKSRWVSSPPPKNSWKRNWTPGWNVSQDLRCGSRMSQSGDLLTHLLGQSWTEYWLTFSLAPYLMQTTEYNLIQLHFTEDKRADSKQSDILLVPKGFELFKREGSRGNSTRGGNPARLST